MFFDVASQFFGSFEISYFQASPNSVLAIALFVLFMLIVPVVMVRSTSHHLCLCDHDSWANAAHVT
jgi:hypothetical protein